MRSDDGSKTVSRLSVSPGTLEMHSTWALQTLNWSTSEPGWLASMMTTLLAEWVLVRIHTRLLMVSVSWSSLDWTEGGKEGRAESGCRTFQIRLFFLRQRTFLFSGELWLLFLPSPSFSALRGSPELGSALAATASWLLAFHPVRSTPAAHHSCKKKKNHVFSGCRRLRTIDMRLIEYPAIQSSCDLVDNTATQAILIKLCKKCTHHMHALFYVHYERHI